MKKFLEYIKESNSEVELSEILNHLEDSFVDMVDDGWNFGNRDEKHSIIDKNNIEEILCDLDNTDIYLNLMKDLKVEDDSPSFIHGDEYEKMIKLSNKCSIQYTSLHSDKLKFRGIKVEALYSYKIITITILFKKKYPFRIKNFHRIDKSSMDPNQQ